MKKKTGHSTKSMWNSIFCWSRFGNKYLLKYYLVLCIVQFYLLPSLLGNPGTSPALQVWEWGIVWSSPVPGGRWVGQIKKKIFSLMGAGKTNHTCIFACLSLTHHPCCLRAWNRLHSSKIHKTFIMQKCPNRQRELKYQEVLHPVGKKANTSLREPILKPL